MSTKLHSTKQHSIEFQMMLLLFQISMKFYVTVVPNTILSFALLAVLAVHTYIL